MANLGPELVSLWGAHIHRRSVVTSTMLEARALASCGAPEGTTVVAETQTQGRGRRGRTWFSPVRAGLWMTTLLRPRARDNLHQLGIVTGVAVRDAVTRLGAEGVGLKWPNDVVVGDRKLAGILLESEWGKADPTSGPVVLVGIGLNLEMANKVDIPDEHAEVGARYIGLRDLLSQRDDERTPLVELALQSVLRSLEACYHQWKVGGLAPSLLAWRNADVLQGQRVQAEGGAGMVEGVADGIDESGALWIRTERGRESITSGEVQRVRKVGSGAAGEVI